MQKEKVKMKERRGGVKVGLVSLGCPKNLVDSELLLGKLIKDGYYFCKKPEQAEVIIVNTCSFIESAKQEAIETILDVATLKTKGQCQKLIVVGCLGQQYSTQLLKTLPEVDAVLGIEGINSLSRIIDKVRSKKIKQIQEVAFVNKTPQYIYNCRSPRYRLTPFYTAYVKIADGCDNFCSYCVIPILRGRYRSRTIEDIQKEIKQLARQQVKEINLIAQDTTNFGKDLYGRPVLDKLLQKISKNSKISWFRLLYTHPAHLTKAVIDTIGNNENICKYIDLPLQHINGQILTRMNRKTTKKQIYELLEIIRKKIPRVALRTTLLVGFPGETETQFQELLDFVKEVRFEKLGVFKYSPEENTKVADFQLQVEEALKEQRFKEIMETQKNISLKNNRKFIGHELKVLVEEMVEPHLGLGRTEYDALEIDGNVWIHKCTAQNGDFIKVKIQDASEYDLIGIQVN